MESQKTRNMNEDRKGREKWDRRAGTSREHLMVGFTTTIPTIRLHVNGRRTPIKSQISRLDVKIKAEPYANSKKPTSSKKCRWAKSVSGIWGSHGCGMQPGRCCSGGAHGPGLGLKLKAGCTHAEDAWPTQPDCSSSCVRPGLSVELHPTPARIWCFRWLLEHLVPKQINCYWCSCCQLLSIKQFLAFVEDDGVRNIICSSTKGTSGTTG